MFNHKEQEIMQGQKPGQDQNHIFSGNIYIFQAYDVGEDINLDAIRDSGILVEQHVTLSKYFKNYHIPLAVTLPEPSMDHHNLYAKIHNFGAISLTYKIPFQATLANIRKELESLHTKYQEQSFKDVSSLYKKIKNFIKKPNFFQMQSSYLVIQVDPQETMFTDIVQLKTIYGSMIASMLRFETESLSEVQKNEILESAMGYYRGDLIVIDTAAAFVYDSEYAEILDFFDFGNIQHLELRYYDRVLDQQLNAMYEEKAVKLPIKIYLPFFGTLSKSPVDELSKLRVDISVITERLESSIKLVGEPYFSELYALLQDKLDLKNWQDGIERKLSIVQDIRAVFQHKVDAARDDILSVLIAILIMIELMVAIWKA